MVAKYSRMLPSTAATFAGHYPPVCQFNDKRDALTVQILLVSVEQSQLQLLLQLGVRECSLQEIYRHGYSPVFTQRRIRHSQAVIRQTPLAMPTLRLEKIEGFDNSDHLSDSERQHNRQQRLLYLASPQAYQAAGQGMYATRKDFRIIYRLDALYGTDRADVLRHIDYLEFFVHTGEARWARFESDADHKAGDRIPELRWGYKSVKGPDYYHWIAALRDSLGEPKDLLPEIKLETMGQGSPTTYVSTAHNSFVGFQSEGVFRGSRSVADTQYDAYIMPTKDGRFWAMHGFVEGIGISSHQNYVNPDARKVRMCSSLNEAVRFVSASPAAPDLLTKLNNHYGTRHQPKRSLLSL